MIKRQSKHQALIIVSGSEGRIEKAQNIAQLLSSRGYICLAIAYFGLERLPKHLKRIPLECLVEAKSYLCQYPQVDSESSLCNDSISLHNFDSHKKMI